ncbi:facilitated trehalose transporter Tret1-like isoform X1 [Plodia interpunctella]|uniref:facilitated trehalose transporter Tret1-like isoform X1 n=1 Tax=Plodia interpunctella TaxID=58824 RepID=UPI002368A82E|nr:facilitated trehalose transporter Tret1-like isoform X1 [Plodia interpunctella]
MFHLSKQLFSVLCAYQGSILIGYTMGWTAPIIPKLQDPEQTPLPDIPTDGQISWIGSLLYIGCIIGPYSLGPLSNVKGRKPCFLISGCIIIVSFILLGAAQNLAMIYAGRVLIGVGLGIISVINVVYIGEVASTNIRGILLSGTGIFSTLGTLIMYAIGPYVSYVMSTVIGIALTLLYLIGLYFIPETPLFNVMKGKEYEAKQILIELGRADETDTVLKSKPEVKKTTMSDWKDLIAIKGNRLALFIVLTLCILQQMSGVVAVIFFATTIFDLAGSIDPSLATILIGITQLIASCITLIFVDKTGRRTLLIFSTATSSISLAVLGIYFYLADVAHNPIADKLGWLPLLSLVVFFLSYDLGFGIIPSALTGEMFEPNVRSLGSAVTSTVAWSIGFGVSTGFGYMLSAWGGHVTFWVYSGACAFATLFSVLFVPETRGKSLLEIQTMLNM